MNILITGASGFAEKNLAARLYAIRDGKDKTRPSIKIDEVFLCTRKTSSEELEGFCRHANFVVHLAGVNRPKNQSDFEAGNKDFTHQLLSVLCASQNDCPFLFASSIQASLTGRYAGSVYGQSKKAAEELVFAYGKKTGANVMVYRFPNIFGKWCRPNYNSVIATFYHNIARQLPITISNPDTELELVYIDDLVEEILDAIDGHPHMLENGYCAVPVSHTATVGEIAQLLPIAPPDFYMKNLEIKRSRRFNASRIVLCNSCYESPEAAADKAEQKLVDIRIVSTQLTATDLTGQRIVASRDIGVDKLRLLARQRAACHPTAHSELSGAFRKMLKAVGAVVGKQHIACAAVRIKG